jgi:PIN domain nuclease of toxin-antitoxin system
VRQAGLPVVSLRQSHVEQLWSLPLVHRDPADRLPIAQSVIESLPLVTCDEIISRYAVDVVW